MGVFLYLVKFPFPSYNRSIGIFHPLSFLLHPFMRLLRVFLCHASQDKPAVWRLHRYLTQHGVKPWLDQVDLLPGEDWEVEIPNAIFSSDVILVCLSKNSVNKEGMVQKEISFALDKALEKPGKIFIIPLKLEECDVPSRLNRYQWVDYYRSDGRKRLLMGLNKRVAELGDEVSPVIMEDSRQRTPRPPSPKPEIKQEEQVAIVPPKEESKEKPKEETTTQISPLPLNVEQRENKPVQQKPFTKILDPSSLSPKDKSRSQDIPRETSKMREEKISRVANPAYKRLLGFGGIALIFFLFAAFGGNYLLNNFPVAKTSTVTPSVTSQPPTSTATKVPLTSTPAITPMPTLGIGSTIISEKDGMVLVYVPAGEFTMGSYKYSDEQPIHQVNLDAFWIDQTEVTNKMYAQCVDAKQCDPPTKTSSYTHPNYFGNPEFNDFPVIYVDWNMAKTYCEWAGRRLPTEAEWEKTASWDELKQEKYAYPWGNYFLRNPANYCDVLCTFDWAEKYQSDRWSETSTVKSYPDGISAYGAYNMVGNVWEWVSSLYKPYPYDASDGRENMSSSDVRVLRGGSWGSSISNVRSANRNWDNPTNSDSNIGFRCTRSP